MSARDEALIALMDALKGRERLLGVDLGTKTIGLALSDVERRIATPLQTLRRVKFTPDAQALRAVALIGPMPGTCSRRRLASFCKERCRSSRSSSTICPLSAWY